MAQQNGFSESHLGVWQVKFETEGVEDAEEEEAEEEEGWRGDARRSS